MTVGFGLVGLGGIAERVAAAIAAADNARLAAVRSRRLDDAVNFAARHGEPSAYSELERLLDDPDVDVVYIATPNALHAEQAIAAMEAGKHVLVEKPMALTVEDAMAMASVADRTSVILGVGFHLRFHPVHLEIRRMIAEGEIGTPIYAESLFGSMSAISEDRWQLDPVLAGHGSLTGLGVHLIDLLPWLLGENVLEVSAFSDGPNAQRSVEWLTTATLRFESETVGVLTSSRRLPNATNSVRVWGTERLVEAVGTIGVDPAGSLRITDGRTRTTRMLELGDLYHLEVEAFARSVETGEPFIPGGDAGVMSVAITAAIAAAAASGQRVGLGGA